MMVWGKREWKRMTDRDRWNQKYNEPMYLYGREPTLFLKQKLGLLRKGRALVLAMGEGRNAVYLAQNGFDVTGVDVSDVAIAKCKILAEERGVKLDTVVADLTDYDLGTEQYELITNFFFYDELILTRAIRYLKPGGIFIFEQFSCKHARYGQFGPKNSAYLVKPSELLRIFKAFRLLYFEDTVSEYNEGIHKGTAAILRLIVQSS